MVIEQRSAFPEGTPSGSARVRAPRTHRPRLHWGYLSRTVSRYGVVSSLLVIYPPEASERDRRRAEISRCYPPVAGGAGLILWIALTAVGVPPLASALLLGALLVAAGVALARSTRTVRRAAAALWSCSPMRGESSEQGEHRRRLDALADTIQAASLAYRSGAMDPGRFERIWHSAYAHAAATRPGPRWVEAQVPAH
ncbi:DUF6611 family protein [Microbacterium sp. ASV81]|uniref:Uncharacterized protein n=1 Tax=Microbacterium capsulatum TaxID=3041921 RepID=A0ABU0XEE0_9MICO|nr:DUF6611 family protein [Microbacterium sp. ASV81]MDQ4213426.1 hypothetical protein [Microbacterium sp. ASV81]